MIKFALIPTHLIIPHIADNVKKIFSDLADPSSDEVDMDWDYYIESSLAGQCVAITARDNNKLVAYNIFTLGNNPRNKKKVEAVGNGLFVEKEYRGKLGINIIKQSERMLNSIGIKDISYMNCGERFDRLLSRLGYKATCTVWSK